MFTASVEKNPHFFGVEVGERACDEIYCVEEFFWKCINQAEKISISLYENLARGQKLKKNGNDKIRTNKK